MTQPPDLRRPERSADPSPASRTTPRARAIVREELRLLATVQRALGPRASGRTSSAARAQALDDERLLELRDDVAVAKPEDLPALFEQMHHLGALRAQRGRSVSGSVDRASPYFGHLRLEETVPAAASGRPGECRRSAGATSSSASRSYVDSGEGIRIVDWRHAPVSRIYYRYGEGDDYEEQLGDRVVEGGGRRAARRQHRRRRARARVGAAGHVRARRGRPAGSASARDRSRLETEKRWAARHGDAAEARLGVGADGQLRQDKHLPAIAAMLDEKQFDAHRAREQRASWPSRAARAAARRPSACTAWRTSRSRSRSGSGRTRCSSSCPNEALIHYVGRVLPSLGVEGVPVTTFARFAARLVDAARSRGCRRGSATRRRRSCRAPSRTRRCCAAIDAARRRASEATVDARVRAAMAQVARRRAGASPRGRRRRRATRRRRPDARVSLLAQWAGGQAAAAGRGPARARLPEVTRSALEQLGSRAAATRRAVGRSGSGTSS